MAIFKRKLSKGIRYFYKFGYQGKYYRSQAIYLTEAQARRGEAEKLKEVEEQRINPVNDMRLIALLEHRLDYIRLNQSYDYYKENRRYFKLAISTWGDIYCSQVTKAMVHALLQAEVSRLKKSGKTPHKANAILRSLKAAFNFGINIYDLNIKNPCLGLKMAPIDINLKYIPTDEDLRKVKEFCSPSQIILIDFVEQTGCRIKEAVRLKWSDIDHELGLCTLWTRKAKNSNLTPRRIPIPEAITRMESGRGQVFKEWPKLPRFFEAKVQQAGVRHFSWHNLRHRRASIWAKEGRTILEIMQLLGHRNISTTQGYLQLLGYNYG